jgi:c-di-GMP-related signal transduction protein
MRPLHCRFLIARQSLMNQPGSADTMPMDSHVPPGNCPEQGNRKFLARQPIFDRLGATVGYEILFRSSLDNYFQSRPGCDASALIVDNYLLFGLQALTGGRKAFLNFSRDALINDYAALLPSEHVVVEILEDVEPDGEVVAACRRLKEAGYCIALDDFVLTENLNELIRYADIIKIDFLSAPVERQREIARRLSSHKIKLLAEKVETREEFERGLQMGCCYFQGYFFSKPQMLTKRNIPGRKLNYLRILQAINRPAIDLSEIETILRQEPSLLYKLLRYLNSVSFGFRNRVASIRHALALLGERNVCKWISVVAILDLADDKPSELIATGLIRARYCEQMTKPLGFTESETDLFLLGLMSVMDAVLDRELKDVLLEIPLPGEVEAALMGAKNRFRPVLDSAIAQEKGDWDAIELCARDMGVDEIHLPEIYVQSVQWVRNLLANKDQHMPQKDRR